MEKLGLGTKSTRHAIIERLYTVKYIQNDPIEPSQLGMAVCDALDKFAPHITHPQMTAELEEEMDNIAEGRQATKDDVVDQLAATCLSEQLAKRCCRIPRRSKTRLADAVAADAYVGKCPKCGKDLQIRVSQKTRGMFIGCAGWPECDVTYPLPKGKVEALPDPCPDVRHAPGEGDGVPLQAAHAVHRSELRDEQGARRGGGRVPDVRRRPARRPSSSHRRTRAP